MNSISPYLAPRAQRAAAGLVSLSTTSVQGGAVLRLDAGPFARACDRAERCARAVRHFADLAEDQARGVAMRRVLVTLTYRPGVEWSQRHVSGFVRAMRAWMRRRRVPFMYVAVAELQERGAVHYHLVVWVPGYVRLPAPDEAGWWPHGMSNVKVVRRPVPYLAKYVGKVHSKTGTFPKGLRMYSCGGLVRARRLWRSWLMLPRYVREKFSVGADVQRAKGGGFVARATGEFLRARWRLESRAGDWSWLQFVEIVE